MGNFRDLQEYAEYIKNEFCIKLFELIPLSTDEQKEKIKKAFPYEFAVYSYFKATGNMPSPHDLIEIEKDIQNKNKQED